MSIKPYFQPENIYNIELDKLEVPTELDKLKVLAEPDKLEVPLPTLEVPQKSAKPTEPAVKYS